MKKSKKNDIILQYYPYVCPDPIDIAMLIIGNIQIDLYKNNDGSTTAFYWSDILEKYINIDGDVDGFSTYEKKLFNLD